MRKTMLALLVVAILLGIGGWYVWHPTSVGEVVKPDTVATTGVSIVIETPLGKPLDYTATATITNDQGQTVKQLTLDKGGSRYNVSLSPGVYKVSLTSPDQKFAPAPDSTVTVTQGKLTTLNISLGRPT